MTTFTMRYVNDNFVVAAPMSRRCSSSRAPEARDWCNAHYPGSPVTEIGPRWGRTPSKSPSLTPSLSPHDPLAKADKKATGGKEVGRSRSRDRNTPPEVNLL